MRVDKKSDLVVRIKEWVDAEYASGRQTIISDGELKALIQQYQPQLLQD